MNDFIALFTFGSRKLPVALSQAIPPPLASAGQSASLQAMPWNGRFRGYTVFSNSLAPGRSGHAASPAVEQFFESGECPLGDEAQDAKKWTE
ncbi:MAG: hypothetical protein ACJ8G3_19880 [Burkholderiaceae bacterium]